MKSRHVFLVVCIIISSTSPLCAMRRAAGTALFSSRFLHNAGVTLSNRLMSTIPNTPNSKWRENDLFQQLLKDPQSPELFKKLRELKEKEQDIDGQADNFTLQAFLRLATLSSNMEHQVFLALLEAGAEINRADVEGQTPLHLLAQNCNKKCEVELSAILAWIAHYKPDFDAVDKHGKTPRDYAPNDLKHHFEYHAPIDPAKLRYMFR